MLGAFDKQGFMYGEAQEEQESARGDADDDDAEDQVLHRELEHADDDLHA